MSRFNGNGFNQFRSSTMKCQGMFDCLDILYMRFKYENHEHQRFAQKIVCACVCNFSYLNSCNHLNSYRIKHPNSAEIRYFPATPNFNLECIAATIVQSKKKYRQNALTIANKK